MKAATAAAGAIAKGAIVDWPTAGIALVALAFVRRFKNKEPILVALSEGAGLLIHPLAG